MLPAFKPYLESYNKQNSIVLAKQTKNKPKIKKQTQRTMEQKRENIISPHLYKKEPIQSEKKTVSLIIGIGKTGPLQAKE